MNKESSIQYETKERLKEQEKIGKKGAWFKREILPILRHGKFNGETYDELVKQKKKFDVGNCTIKLDKTSASTKRLSIAIRGLNDKGRFVEKGILEETGRKYWLQGFPKRFNIFNQDELILFYNKNKENGILQTHMFQENGPAPVEAFYLDFLVANEICVARYDLRLIKSGYPPIVLIKKDRR